MGWDNLLVHKYNKLYIGEYKHQHKHYDYSRLKKSANETKIMWLLRKVIPIAGKDQCCPWLSQVRVKTLDQQGMPIQSLDKTQFQTWVLPARLLLTESKPF